MTASCKLFRKYIFPVNFVSSQKAWLLLCELCHCRKLFKDRVFLGVGEYLDQSLPGMCRYPLRAPTPLESILWPIIGPILTTFGETVTRF